MAATSDENDLRMNGRLARAYANPENKEWAAAFFDSGTHPNHGDPAERARHERHIQAVAQLQTDIAADHAAAEYRATLAHQTGVPRQQIEAEIQRIYATPGWADSTSRDHQAAIDRLTYLYKQLHPSK